MAKHLAKVIILGAQLIGKAFAKSLREEFAVLQEAAKLASGGAKVQSRAAANSKTGMTLEEAQQILNIRNINNKEEIENKYKHLFDVNEKSEGGSFYLQSKVFRAKERINDELKQQLHDTAKKLDSTNSPTG